MQSRTSRTKISPRIFNILTAALCLSSFLSVVEAKAADLIWNDVVAQGSGDGVPCRYKTKNPSRNNVFWSAAGGDLSIILTNWGISLPKIARFTGGKLATSSVCNFTATVTIPQGYYLKTLAQTLVVGVQKDRLTSGGISSNGYLFQTLIPLNQINMVFRPDQAIHNELMHVTNTQIFVEPYISGLCQASRLAPFTTQFKFQLLGGAVRPFPQIGLEANVDGSDVQFGLDSSLERCSQ